MREDHAGVRVVTRVPDHVLTKRRDPASGVDQDGERAIVREREQPGHVRMVECELLRAWMQLDSPRAPGERPLCLEQRPIARFDTAERHEQAVAAGCRLDHEVIGRLVSVRLVHREDKAATCIRDAQPGQQLLRALAHTVRVVLPEVGVGVE